MEVQLLHGVWRAGRRYGTACLRDLTGRDEAYLLELPAAWSAARRTSALLERVVEPIEGLDEPVSKIVRLMSGGDRERLLVALCQRLLGDRIDLVAGCGVAECRELSEISLSLETFVADQTAKSERESFELNCDDADRNLHVRFRLPNGFMEEAAARTARSDPALAAKELIAKVVLDITDDNGEPVDLESVQPIVAPAVESAVQMLEPGLDRHTAVTCAACGVEFVAEFDALSILTNALTRGGDIFRQVARLASVYHWSEADILALSATRRQTYLHLIETGGGAK